MSGSPKHNQLQEAPEDQSATQEVPAPEMLDPPQGAEGGSSPPTAVASPPGSPSQEGSSSSEGEDGFHSQAIESLVDYAFHGRVADLVVFLLIKYRNKELTSREEMLQTAFQDFEELFPEVFREVSECLYVVFGIDVKRVNSSSQSYVLMPALGLSYDGTRDDVPSFPKTTILIIVLGVIFFEGNSASEEAIWEVLGGIGVHPGCEHVVYGEPRKFVTEDLVQEQYLQYRQVPNSDPARSELVWGPRALIETTKMDILEFFARIKDTTPSAFSVWYEEALSEEKERFQLPDLSHW